MGLQETLADNRLKLMNTIHRTVLTVSGGRIGNTLASMPVVELRTIGRTSGKHRSTMLTTPIQEDGTYVLVASKGGDDRDPDWYRNLVADPEIVLLVDGEDIPLVARTATADEKADLWPRIVEAYRGYEGYASKTDRDIPVVICEPRPS